ncbi:Sirt2, partial [Symbiodinium pilosum]
VHALLARMEQEGLLLRVYTQNIDGLEHAAGVSAGRVIECHGTTTRVVCATNPQHAVQGLTATAVANQVLQGQAAPRCPCGSLIRPDIVFFGEPLPAEFHRHSGEDLASCDLLLVIGTALSVYPVAGLVARVPALTPRLLINREAVGPWRGAKGNPENYRDVHFDGDCDAGAEQLANELSWPLRIS